MSKYKLVLKDSRSLLEDWKDKSIYTVDYTVINTKKGTEDRIAEKVLAYDYEEAKQIIEDSYEGPDLEFKFSPYNPIKIEDLELFIIDALDEAHIIRANSSYKNH